MKRIGITGLCLVAVCAMSALATATASAALPEWGRCVKFINAHGKPVGNYAKLQLHDQDRSTQNGKL